MGGGGETERRKHVSLGTKIFFLQKNEEGGKRRVGKSCARASDEIDRGRPPSLLPTFMYVGPGRMFFWRSPQWNGEGQEEEEEQEEG